MKKIYIKKIDRINNILIIHRPLFFSCVDEETSLMKINICLSTVMWRDRQKNHS